MKRIKRKKKERKIKKKGNEDQVEKRRKTENETKVGKAKNQKAMLPPPFPLGLVTVDIVYENILNITYGRQSAAVLASYTLPFNSNPFPPRVQLLGRYYSGGTAV